MLAKLTNFSLSYFNAIKYELQVGRETLVPRADYALNSIHNITEALHEIWEEEEEENLSQLSNLLQ